MSNTAFRCTDPVNREKGNITHIGLLEADEDKIRKIRPKGTQVRMLYVPREVDLADKTRGAQRPEGP